MSQYGLSVTEKSAYSVNSKGQKFFYHTLPEVSSVSPTVGADMGGTFITIEGKGFDGYKDNTQVTLMKWALFNFIQLNAKRRFLSMMLSVRMSR